MSTYSTLRVRARAHLQSEQFTLLGVLCSLALAGACSPSGGRSEAPRGQGGDTGASGGATGSSGATVSPSGDGTGGVLVISSGGTSSNGSPCADETSWACKIATCDGQQKTTVRATVYDPSGKLPLYDVAVYVPNKALDDIEDGATCETCATPVSGQPIASALTNAAGEFVMEDVPSGSHVPLVIQIGKWRREVELSEVKPCQENKFDDPELFRLPRNQGEGHLPKIALSAGEADSLECLLRRLAISDSEFTNPDGRGRINIFADKDSATSYATAEEYPPASPTLWGSDDSLGKYDVVLMSCQGSQSDGRLHLTPEKEALKHYVDGGGRVFLEHYHYSWLRGGNEDPEIEDARKYPPTPFPPVAIWATAADPDVNNGYEGNRDYQIDVSFPKGNDFADWLVNVQASTKKGVISLQDVKHPALDIVPSVSQRWIYNVTGSPQSVPYLTANTPIGVPIEKQCGRLVHTGIHVAKAAKDKTTDPFPSGCTSAPLSAQEKAMAFLFFDLSSCVQNEKDPPARPPIIR
jgi:hypothetical protein